MIKTLVVVGHPNLSESIVNKAWTESLQALEDDNVKVHVLSDAIGPNGQFNIVAEQALLCNYNRIILQFPLYWYMVPVIMKQWMDTVWCEGFCYGDGGIHLEGKWIEIATSCGAPEFCFNPEKGGVAIAEYTSFLQGSAAFVRGKAGRVFAFYGAGGPDCMERLKENVLAYKAFVLSDPTEQV